MDPVDVTVKALLGAVCAVSVVGQVVVGVALLRERAAPTPARLLTGLGAAVVTHLCLYYVTGSPWVAAVGVVPMVVVAVLCTPRTWQPPPRAGLRRSDGYDSSDGQAVIQPVAQVTTAAEQTPAEQEARTGAEGSSSGDTSGGLSWSEQQAWESIRRAYDEP